MILAKSFVVNIFSVEHSKTNGNLEILVNMIVNKTFVILLGLVGIETKNTSRMYSAIFLFKTLSDVIG